MVVRGCPVKLTEEHMDRWEQLRYPHESASRRANEILDRVRHDNLVFRARYKEALKSGARVSELLDMITEDFERLRSVLDLDAP